MRRWDELRLDLVELLRQYVRLRLLQCKYVRRQQLRLPTRRQQLRPVHVHMRTYTSPASGATASAKPGSNATATLAAASSSFTTAVTATVTTTPCVGATGTRH